MKKTVLKSLALVVIGSFCVVGAANAHPMLEGGLSMIGIYTLVDVYYGKTSIATATGIDFEGYSNTVSGNKFLVSSATRDFEGLVGNVRTITDFQFNSFTPISYFWTACSFSFDMTDLPLTKYTVGSPTIAIYYGFGLLSAVGYEDTLDTWSYSSQGAESDNFTWSASVAAEPVPEPATMLLFGTGLIGLAGISRRRNIKIQAM